MPHTEPPAPLTTALRRILHPLVRLLIHYNITLPYLVKLLKRSYVEVANEHFGSTDKPLTDSRISVLTGVHRKDVKHFRESPMALESAPKSLSISSRILGLWQGHPDYQDHNNHPAPLSRSQFDLLVSSVSTDIRPRTILDEWFRQGYVDEQDGKLSLNISALVPSENFEGMAHYFGSNLRDHLAAAGDNLIGSTPPHLERAVFYSNLSEESIQTLQAIAREQGIELLQTLNSEALRRVEQDSALEGANHRFRFGIYFYQQQEAAKEEKP